MLYVTVDLPNVELSGVVVLYEDLPYVLWLTCCMKTYPMSSCLELLCCLFEFTYAMLSCLVLLCYMKTYPMASCLALLCV